MKDQNSTSIDVAIIGGGIVGLWTAYAILNKHPDFTVVVFEKEKFFGEHTTGRNSEVLHSGIYYENGSQKHFHCMKGNEMWREYIQKTQMPFLPSGKIIVGTKEQAEGLEKLFKKAQDNRVLGLRMLNSSEISEYQNIVNVDIGFLVPTAGVLDVSAAIACLKNDIERMGGILLPQSKVELASFKNNEFILSVNGEHIKSSALINAGGLFAVDFRKSLGLSDYTNYFVKGNYLKLKKNLEINKLVYPVPPSHGLGLGVHLTLDTAGGQKFGPDTETINELDYSLQDSLLDKMFPAINDIFKGLKKEDLLLGYSGIRPKIKKDYKLIQDFVFNDDRNHHIKGYYELLGIESPGLTSAPSLAKMLSDLI